MYIKRRNLFKTYVFARSSIQNAFLLLVSAALLILIFACIINFSVNKGFATFFLDKFFGQTAYAEFTEIFTDAQGRVNTILGGYTMIIGEEKPIVKSPSPSPAQYARENTVVENTVSVTSEIKNQTEKTVDCEKLVSEPLSYIKAGKKPSVLIVHTHTTESYLEQDRSIDEEKNMIAIGRVVKEKLIEGGIEVIHDTTVHDYPSYNGAYTRSAATTKNRINENPDINIVLDIHRDAVQSDDGSKLSLVTQIADKKAAQLMFVVGTDAQLSHPKWQENMKLALKLQRCADTIYPTLMRPINLREQRFNQQLSEGSIILEVGTNGNSIEEAKYSASLISDVILKVLNNN